MKKKIIILGVVFILFCLNGWHIEFEENSVKDITIDYTEDLVMPEPVAYLKGNFLLKNGIKLNTKVDGDIIDGKVGKYPIKYKASFFVFSKEIDGYYIISDSEYPIIVFDLLDDTYILPGEDYTLYSAYDNYDGDITDKVIVDEKEDSVIYSVTDSFGNTTTVVKNKVTDETKIIYLTFDDGPSKYTEELLEILKKYNVRATFFVVGTYYSDVLSKIAEDGHAIGIHTYSHEFKDIYKSEENYFADLNKIQDIIFEKTGSRSDLLRFPGGTSNTVSRKYNKGIMSRLSELVVEQGFQYFDWNVDSDDAGRARDSETVFENVKTGVDGKRIAVVLQHDTKKFSIDAVEQIIIWGEENGYVFLPLNKYSFNAHHNALN